jgi:hypothetical protein
MRLATSQFAAVDVVLESVLVRDAGLAADPGIDGSWVIQLVDGLRQWASRMGMEASAQAAFAPGERPRSDLPGSDVLARTGGFSVVHPTVATDHAADLDKIGTMADADSWTEFLSPAFVALSVALVAQVSRLLARWWKSRIRPRAGGVADRLDRGSEAAEPVLPNCVVPWIDEIDLTGTEVPVSRAS